MIQSPAYNEKHGPSLALWVPVVWYFIAASRSLSRWINPQIIYSVEIDYLEGTAVDRNLFIVLIILAGIILSARMRGQWKIWFKDNRFLVALLVLMALSITWSPFPFVSLKRWIKSVGALLMVMVVLTEEDPVEAIRSLFKRNFYVILPLSLIFIKYYRQLGVAWSKDGKYQMWVGVTTHKNHLGQVCMTAAIFFLWDLIRIRSGKRSLISLPFLALALFLMNGPGYSRSTTSIVVLLIGVAIMSGLHFVKRSPEMTRTFLTKSAVAMILIYVILQLAAGGLSKHSAYSMVVTSTGRDTTLTGRTELWLDIINVGMKHPLTGVGYGSFWLGDLGNDLWEKHIWQPGQGHNGYVDVFVELGFPGLFLLLCIIVSRWKGILRMFPDNFELARFQLTVFVMIIINNITESSFLRGTHNLWFLFLLVAVNFESMVHDRGLSSLQNLPDGN